MSTTHLFERFPTALYDTVSNLHCRHPPRIRRTCVTVRDVRDVLEPELSCVQYPAQCLPYDCNVHGNEIQKT